MKRAFTLIELLVVIAIIGLLLSVLVPSLRMAKQQMRFVKCKTNQRGILEAVNVYMAGHDFRLPPSTQGTEGGHWTIPMRLKYHYGTDGLNGGSVVDVLGDYMASPEYFDCPLAAHSADWQSAYLQAARDDEVKFVNCSYYLLWNWRRFQDTRPRFRPTDDGGDTLMTCDFLMYDEPQNNNYHGGTYWIGTHPWRGASRLTFADAMVGSTLNEGFTFWMQEGSYDAWPEMKLSAGYKDGHVETFKSEDYEHMGGVYFLPKVRR